MFCGECGAEIGGNPKYCPVCGASLERYPVRKAVAPPKRRGKVRLAKPENGACPLCRGSGTCTRCRGSGECSVCGGTGAVGKGWIRRSTCQSCMGSAKCHVCKGTGKCSLCGGSGRYVDDGRPWE